MTSSAAQMLNVEEKSAGAVPLWPLPAPPPAPLGPFVFEPPFVEFGISVACCPHQGSFRSLVFSKTLIKLDPEDICRPEPPQASPLHKQLSQVTVRSGLSLALKLPLTPPHSG